MPEDPAERFANTERYYAEYRPGYGEDAIGYLVDRFDIDAGARVLDLGCGAGQLSVPLAGHAGTVVGMDPNPAMLDEACTRATAAGRRNIEWVQGADADLDSEPESLQIGSVQLVTMGRSFHWMAQERTLDLLHALLQPGGGVAIATGEEWLVRGDRDWQATVYAVVERYLNDLPERETGDIEYDDPWDALLETKGYESVQTVTFGVERDWTITEIIGYVFSLSYCSPDRFGDDMEAFQAAVRERLDEFGKEPFKQVAEIEVIAGREPA